MSLRSSSADVLRKGTYLVPLELFLVDVCLINGTQKCVFEDSVGMRVADTTLLHLVWHKVGDFLTLRYHLSSLSHKVCK